jgi:hypothetical protein
MLVERHDEGIERRVVRTVIVDYYTDRIRRIFYFLRGMKWIDIGQMRSEGTCIRSEPNL